MLKGFSALAAQALPLADGSNHRTKLGDEAMLVRDLMHKTDAQLCYVELMGPSAPPAFPFKRPRRRKRPPAPKPIAVYFPPRHPPADGPDGVA